MMLILSNRQQTNVIYYVTSKLFSPTEFDEAVEVEPFINVTNITISSH